MTETPDPFAPRPDQPAQPPPPPPQQPQPGYGYPAAPPPGYQVPPQTYAQPYGAPAGYGPPGAGQSNGLAIAALVLGIAGCLAFWVPFVGALAGLIGLVLGIVAWRRASAGRAGGKTMAIIGTVLGGLALVGGILATVLIIWVFGRVAHCTDANLTDEELKTCVNQEFGVE